MNRIEDIPYYQFCYEDRSSASTKLISLALKAGV